MSPAGGSPAPELPRQRDLRTHRGIPVHALIDRTAVFLREGYPFFSRRFTRWGSNVVETRLLGRRAVCLRGREGAEVFYDASRIRSARMVPLPIERVLFGKGAVHVLGGDEHLHRKAMFLSVTTDPRSLRRLRSGADERYATAALRWQQGGRVNLFDEAVVLLGEIACRWAGIPLDGRTTTRSRDLSCIVDGFGSAGPRLVRAALARSRAEGWARGLVADVRAGHLRPPTGSALAVVASHRDLAGRLLPERLAAVELLNFLRPTVAVAWYVAFAGLALHRHPEWRERLAAGDDALAAAFACEVRRVYPFAPALADRTRRAFPFRDRLLPRGRMVVLDVYGTCHDPAAWPDPDTFDPRRFLGRQPDPYAFVPQGGGDPATGHRCAGEQVTNELLEGAVRLLASLRYDVPAQDLHFPLDRMPTRPRSGVVLTGVHVPARAGITEAPV